jgi:hypothetical protein
MIRILVPLLVAAAMGYALHAFAQVRIDTRSTVTPVASSSSEGVSFVWFYDASDRSVYVCQTRGGQSTMECKPRANLP